MRTALVTTTYLELTTPDQLDPVPAPGATYSVRRESPCPVATHRYLYDAVGHDHHWRDRLTWSDETLATYLAKASISVWILRDADAMGGYFELKTDDDGAVEIAYFGLVPAFQGRGLGKWLLTRAAMEAWALKPTRVWLHTCTLDGPAALPNYVARGFRPYRTERHEAALRDDG